MIAARRAVGAAVVFAALAPAGLFAQTPAAPSAVASWATHHTEKERIVAIFDDPTGRYGHGALDSGGPDDTGSEWARLIVSVCRKETAIDGCGSAHAAAGALAAPNLAALEARAQNGVGAGGDLEEAREHAVEIRLPASQVFEDLKPRFADLDGDGDYEVLAVLADARLGAALVAYRPTVSGENALRVDQLAATEPIGRRHRWLAVVGVADFDGDGDDDVAYVDRPHLAGVLRIVGLRDGRLAPLRFANGEEMAQGGFSNHRFGEPFIRSGLRACDGGLEIVLASFDWSTLVAARVTPDGFETRRLADWPSRENLERVLRCEAPVVPPKYLRGVLPP